MAGVRSPTFAAIIPLYNHAAYIEEALESVLLQSHAVDEIILIDDGSSDNGFERAERLLKHHAAATLIQQENRGAHNTMNRAIQSAGAEYIAVLNSDDSFLPGKIEVCRDIFSGKNAPDLIFGRVEIMDGESLTLQHGVTVEWLARAYRSYAADLNLTSSLLNENFAVTTSNMVFRKALWERNGAFQALRYCHDLEFLMASLRNGRVAFSDEQMIRYRVHATNTIKEAPIGVHVEIAAVVADALFSNADLLLSPAAADRIAPLDAILRSKRLSDLINVCVPLRAASETKPHFYELVASRPVALALSEVAGRSLEVAPLEADIMRRATAPRKERPMTVLIELGSFDKGGLEKVVLDSAILFKRRGLTPLIVSVGHVGHLGKIASDHGIEVVQLPTVGREVFYRELLRVRNVDIGMSHFSRVGYRLFREIGIPNITFIHNVYAMLPPDAVAAFVADDAYVDLYISVSPKATRYAEQRLDVAPDKIVTIPNGLIFSEHERQRISAVPARREDFGLAESDYVFLNVASYNLHKGHYLMAEALKGLLRRRRDIKILCIGNEIRPPHVAELRNYISANGLQDHFLMPGYFSDIAPIYAITDAFVLPSFIEGWSIAMNEAMFYGKPLVMTDTGGAAEVIENEDIGILIPNEYGDVENLHAALLDELSYKPRAYRIAPMLADAMARFADEPAVWKQAGRRARIKVLRNYDFSRVVENYVTIAKELAARGANGQRMGGR